MILVRLVILLAMMLLGITAPSLAQVATGTPPFGSNGGSVDSINMSTLNVHLTVPVAQKAGRGMPFTYDLTYDSSVWQPTGSSGHQTWQPVSGFGFGSSTFESGMGYLSFNEVVVNQYLVLFTNYVYTDAIGTSHFFPTWFYFHAESGECVNSNTGAQVSSVAAADGSGYLLHCAVPGTSGFTITSPTGSIVTPPGLFQTAGPGIDSNGNETTFTAGTTSTYTDTLGTTALTIAGSGTPSSPITYSYTAPSGATAKYTAKYASYTIKTNFGCSGVSEYGPTANNLVSEIDLPDGSKYSFNYEQTPGYSGDYTGRLASVTLPTGGTISYVYAGGSSGHITCSDGTAATLERYTPDTGSNFWTYAHSESGTAWTTIVTDPQGNQTDLYFQALSLNGTTSYTYYYYYYAGPVWQGYETQRNVYQGSGTLLQTVNTCYNGATSPCNSTAIALPIARRTAYPQWPGGLTSEIDTQYNSYGQPTEVDEYAYGSGAPGSIMRKTLTTYSYMSNNYGFINKPASVTVQDGSGATKAVTNYTYDGASLASSGITTQHVSISGSRGNATQVSSLVSGSTYVNQNFTYFDTGMVNVAKDGKNNPTTYAYSSTYQGAYPTTITNALNQATTVTYDINSGLVTSAIDANNQPTSYAYDSMLRPTVMATCCSYTTINYQSPNTAQIVQNVNNSGTQRDSYVAVDGLGRKNRVAIPNGEVNPFDETLNTCFNSSGLVSFQAYPFQDSGWTGGVSCTLAGDSYTFDALGRPTRITHADGSYGTISYAANCATATDEQGKSRQVCADGLGRVSSVVENPGGLNYTTTYAYDPLNNLTSVVQGSETRSFVYDGLSRLTSATNPESGASSYTYDADSNVLTRLDARNITTTYSYDALNRLASKTYSDGATPGAYFYYDQSSWNGITLSNGIGRLTSQGVYNGSQWLASSAFSYDGLGHVTNNSQWTLTINSILQVPYTYDLVGDMLTYGNGASWLTFTQSFNVGGRVTGVTSSWVDSQHPGTLVSGAHYNGAGSVTSFTYGNGLTHTRVYNSLLQPCLIDANSSNTLLQTCNDSSPSGNVLDFWYGYNAGSSDNGNIMNWNATGQQSSIRTYTYDALNRLGTMADSATGATCKGLSWSYDQWGNRTAQNVTAGTCGSSQLSYNSYNHVTNTGFQYDAAGNMTHDASHSYTYDAENRITAVDGGSTATYGYGVDGRRVSRVVAGVETDYIYDLSGRVVATYGGGCGNNCWNTGFIYLNGQMVAQYWGGTYFVHSDHLGSTRLLTGYPTASVVECDDYYPFGEQVSCGGTSTTTHKFTGYERDAESGLDNAQARYNSSSLGRFMSPDPLGNFVADATKPQTWNMYAYVSNNPLRMIDPSGTDALDGLDCPGGGGGNDCGGPNLTIWEDFSNTGFGPSYTMDDAPASAAAASSALGNADAAVQCPGACEAFATNSQGYTQYVQYHAFPGLASAVDGYYAVGGPGSLSYNQDQAGIAAAKWGAWFLGQTGREVGGSLWCAYGVCSSTLQKPGEPGAGSVVLNFNFSDIPGGTNAAGWWRATMGESPASDLNAIDAANRALNAAFPLYTGDAGDPGNPVLIYDPNRFGGYECVFVGPTPSSGGAGACGR